MTDAEIYRGFETILADVFPGQTIAVSPSLSAADVLGWDSLRMILIIGEVEEKFGLEFSGREIDGLKNLGDFAALIKSRA